MGVQLKILSAGEMMSNTPQVRIESVSMVKVSELTPHPKNRNKHTEEQIERLAKIIEYQGWRYPVKVSKQSGFITSGHGRVLAAQLRGWEKVPVSYQDYDSEDQEYLDVQSDNAIASWSELDYSGINMDLADLGPDVDLDLLGIKDFVLDVAEKEEISNAEFGRFSAEYGGESSGSRQINIVFDPDEYEDFVKRVKPIMVENGLETMKHLILLILGEYERHHSE